MRGTRFRVVLLALALSIPLLGARGADAFVYWADYQYSAIGRAASDGSDARPQFLAHDAFNPCGIAVDAAHMWWGSETGTSVGRADLTGAGANASFIGGGAGPCGVAVDSAHVYWANGGPGFGFHGTTLGRANLDGSGVNQSLVTGATGPCGVAVDSSHLYWANFNNGSGTTIGRAGLDGGGASQAFITTAAAPCGVAVDSQHVYWINGAGTGHTIGRADLAGTNVNQSFITIAGTLSGGLAVYGGYIYWNQDTNAGGAIGRANLNGSNVNEAFIAGLHHSIGVAADSLSASTTTVVPSADPTHYGNDLSFQAQVTGTQGVTPTGSVNFTVTGEPPVPVQLDSDGKAVYDPPYYLDVGDHVDVDYGGDSKYVGSHAGISPEIHSASTSMTVTVPSSAVVGQSVIATVKVVNTSTSITPFGTVSLWIDGEYFGNAPLDEKGEVTGSLTPLEPGDYNLIWNYVDDTGDPPDFESAQKSLVIHVDPAPSPSAPPPPPLTTTAPVLTVSPVAPSVQAVLGTRDTAPACKVPRLKGLKLARAKRRLAQAHCAVGRVTRRKARTRQRGTVLSSRPGAGRSTTRPVALVVGK